jgi:hypothetical protein
VNDGGVYVPVCPKDNGIGRCHFCSHSRATYIQVVFTLNLWHNISPKCYKPSPAVVMSSHTWRVLIRDVKQSSSLWEPLTHISYHLWFLAVMNYFFTCDVRLLWLGASESHVKSESPVILAFKYWFLGSAEGAIPSSLMFDVADRSELAFNSRFSSYELYHWAATV